MGNMYDSKVLRSKKVFIILNILCWHQSWLFFQLYRKFTKNFKILWKIPFSFLFVSHIKKFAVFMPIFLIFIFKIFNWRIIGLQCCVGVCHTTTWISSKHAYVPSLLNFPSIPQPHPTLQAVTEHQHQVELPVLCSNT